jgi:catechol 2,3-dioxygenase-like lactoylglutathione lyase family enzyme
VTARVRLIGINHVALEVGSVDEALEWYGRVFEVTLRGRVPGMAFVDMGDQFLALSEERRQPPDDARHVGVVVDDKEEARRRLEEAGARILPGRRLDFLDPWGNRIEVVDYRDVQFTKAPSVARGMGIADVEKRPAALEELREKGLS